MRSGSVDHVHSALVGATIELRPFTLGDAPAVHSVYSDPEVMRWVGRGPVTSVEATRTMLRQYIAHQDAHGFAFWAVIDRETGSVIGDAGLAVTLEGEVEMGYTLGRAWWRQGRASEAAGLWVDAAFSRLGIPRLRALVEAPNAGSRRVLENLGFREDGVTDAFGRPHLVYRLERPAPRL